MTSPLQNLSPKHLWSHFDTIRQIPRPSKHEQRIADHVERWAEERGHQLLRDAAGSMTVRVPATPGHEDAPIVVLQGHLDMVCEKNADVDHDFMNQGIDVEVDGDWVHARGTTLGADNGIGVAAAMAAADDPAVVHGPLEILCTIDEETGLTGAKLLDPSIVGGRIMINLDTEEDGAVYIGCAGGGDTDAELAIARRRAGIGSVPVRLIVRGLRGGHSGLNIIENRANAIKLMVRILLAAIEAGVEIDLVSFDGGSKHNAIPREAFATCRILEDSRATLRELASRSAETFKEEFGSVDPGLEVALEELEDQEEHLQVLNVHARDRLLHILSALPHGVLSMSREVPGLVETSTNLAVVATEAARALFTTSQRSSIMPALHAARAQARSVFLQAGAKVTLHESYPGWKPDPASPIVQRTVAVFERLFGRKPEVKAIHAGLECGLLLEKIPGMDAVSIGPQIENAHSPEERVQISSVQRFYEHLKALLADIA